MSIAVNFYEFEKRENSTKRPVGTGTTCNCFLKDGCGVTAPIFEIGTIANPVNLNYCYVPDFNRYYFIDEWTYLRGIWSAHCSVDALASYRADIGNSTQYILRSSYTYNGNVMDNLYPVTSDFEYDTTVIATPFAKVLSNGCFALKVINSDSNVGVSTYLLNQTQMTALMGYMFNTIDWAQISDEEMSIEMQKATINPFQYIISCTWLPVGISGTPSTIKFGYWESGIEAYKVSPYANSTGTVLVNLPAHPQSANRGAYLNLAPYTRRSLYLPVVGMIPIDTTMLNGITSLIVNWGIDLCSGNGTIELYAGSNLINSIKYQAGVPVSLSQLRSDIAGGISNIVGAIGSGASAFAGNVAGGIAGAISGIGNAISSLMPQPQTNGVTGSFADYFNEAIQNPKLVSQFASIVAEDNEDRGRPLCAKRTILNIPGYILCADADIAISGTSAENAAIKSYMNGGFFYE